MAINTKLSLKGCWRMVNAIWNGKTPEEILRRCNVATEWLNANEIIDAEQYNDLMMAVSMQYREAYRLS